MSKSTIPAMIGVLAFFASSRPVCQQDPEPAFLRHIPADCDSLLYIGDSLPVILGVLQSEALRKELTEGGLGQLLAITGEDPPDLDRAAATVRLAANHVPAAVCIAVPSESLASVSEALRCGLLYDLMTTADAVGGETHARALPGLQRDLLDALETVAGIRATVYVQSRGARTAEFWFESLLRDLPLARNTAGLSVEREADTLTLTLSLDELLSPGSLAAVLDDQGLIDGVQDPMLPEFRRVLAQLRFTLSCELVESGLVVSLGESGPERKSVVDLDEQWSGKPEPFVWGAWNIEALKEGLNAFAETWSEWEDTDVGAVSLEYDEEDLIGTILTQVELMSQIPTVGSMSIQVDEDVRATIVSQRVPALPLESSGVLERIPSDVKILTVDGTQSLGDMASELLLRVEDRLAATWFKAMARDDMDQVAEIEALTAQYYDGFAEIRQLILDDSRAVFRPPSAIIMRNGATVRIRPVGEDGEGTGEFVELILPAFAAIGRVGSPDRARELVQTFLNEVFSAAGADVSRLNESFSADLGLGRPTFRLPISSLRGPLPVRFETPTDSFFHGFFVQGYLVLSTSTELSERILDADDRFPPPEGSDGLIALREVDGSEVVEAFDEIAGAIVGLSHSSLTPGTEPSQTAHAAAQGITALGRIVGLLGSFSSMTVDDGERFRTTMRMTFLR